MGWGYVLGEAVDIQLNPTDRREIPRTLRRRYLNLYNTTKRPS